MTPRPKRVAFFSVDWDCEEGSDPHGRWARENKVGLSGYVHDYGDTEATRRSAGETPVFADVPSMVAWAHDHADSVQLLIEGTIYLETSDDLPEGTIPLDVAAAQRHFEMLQKRRPWSNPPT